MSFPFPRARARTFFPLVLLALAAAALVAPASAQAACDKTWNGGSGNWHNANNWTPVGVPNGGQAVCITAPGTYTVLVERFTADPNSGSTAGTPELHLGDPGEVGTQTLRVVSSVADAINNAGSLQANTGEVGPSGVLEFDSTAAGTNVSSCMNLEIYGRVNIDSLAAASTYVIGGEFHVQPGGVIDIYGNTVLPSTSGCGTDVIYNEGGQVNVRSGATFTNQDTFDQSNGATNVEAGSVTTGAGYWHVSGGDFTGEPVLVTGNNDLKFSGGSGVFRLQNGNQITSDVGPDITLSIEGTTGQNASLSPFMGGTWDNAGTIELTSTDPMFSASLSGGAPTLNNTGAILLLPGTGGMRYLQGNIQNLAGGLIDVRAGTIAEHNSAGVFLNDGGTIDVEDGSALNLASTYQQNLGVLAGNTSGNITSNNNTAFAIGGGSLTGAPPTLTNPNLYTTGGSGTIKVHDGAFRSNSLGAALTVISEGSTGNDSVLTSIPDVAGVFTNNGTIQLTSTDAANSSTLSGGNNDTVNLGTIEVLPGAGGARAFTNSINNQGGVTIGASTTHSAGTFTQQSGTLTVAPAAAFTINGTYVQTGGATTVNGSMESTASAQTFNMSGGSLTGNAVVLNNPNFRPTGGSGVIKVHDGAIRSNTLGANLTVVSEGTTGNDSLLTSIPDVAGVFTNNGTIQLTSTDPANFASLSGGNNNTVNLGTIEVLPGSGGARWLSDHITNQGEITISSDTSHTNSFFTNDSGGTITIDAGVTWTELTNYQQTGGTVNVDGALTINNGANFRNYGGDIVGGAVVVNGGAQLHLGGGDGDVVLRGQRNFEGDMGADMKLTIEGTAAGTAGIGGVNGTLAGTIEMTSSGGAYNTYISVGAPVTNSGVIRTLAGSGGSRDLDVQTNTGSYDFETNTGLGANWASSGTVNVDSGVNVTGNRTLSQSAGTVTVDGTYVGSVNLAGGTFDGEGTVQGALSNTGGTVSPNGALPGDIDLTGAYNQGAAGTFVATVNGITAGADHDRIAATGASTLNGTLNIVTGAYTPASGDILELASSGSIAGTFATLTGTALGSGVSFVPNYTAAAARLSLAFDQTVAKSGTGGGTVDADTGSLDCGATCTSAYADGASVTLTATPDATSNFDGWSGAGCTGTATCIVTANAAQTVTANFTRRTHGLTVTRAGSGSGTVTSSPAGISCGATCNLAFDEGTSVTLTANPATGSSFTGWSGSGCSGTGTCMVTASAAQAVTATFTLIPISAPAKLSGPKILTADKKGTFRLTLTNPNAVLATARITVTTKIGRKNVVIGKATAKIGPNGKLAIKVTLNKRGKSLLKARKRLKAVATVTLSANGTARTSKHKLTIKARR